MQYTQIPLQFLTLKYLVKTGQWYEIRIVVTPNLIECYLDDKLIHSFPVESVLPIYETASIEEETGDLIIKLVNELLQNRF